MGCRNIRIRILFSFLNIEGKLLRIEFGGSGSCFTCEMCLEFTKYHFVQTCLSDLVPLMTPFASIKVDTAAHIVDRIPITSRVIRSILKDEIIYSISSNIVKVIR